MWGIHRSLVNSTHKGQWRGTLMFSLICAWINGWVNNREAGDMRRHCAHYDAIVMCCSISDLPPGRLLPAVPEGDTTLERHVTVGYTIFSFHPPHWSLQLDGDQRCAARTKEMEGEQRRNFMAHRGRNKMAAIFPDDIFKCILLNGNVWILIKISLKFVPEGPINNIPALILIMAWCQSGNKPLSESMMA